MIILGLIVVLTACDAQDGEIGQEDIEKIEEPIVKVELADGQIEEMPIEEYVAGVVTAEMKADWPVNAYGAQAILARTFAMKQFTEEGTDLISGDHRQAQAYTSEGITEDVREAVEKTRGEVAIHNGQFINSWFHSSAAGKTTTAQVGLGFDGPEPEYTAIVESPDQNAPEDVQSWEADFEQQEVLTALTELGLEGVEQIESIEIAEKDPTERVVDFTINHNSGADRVGAAEFRNALGPDSLKSTLITSIEADGNQITFAGSGWGHGVGMSQWGAHSMAEDGRSAEEIIDHYYKNIQIIEKWD